MLAAVIPGFDADAILQGLEAGPFIPRSGLLSSRTVEDADVRHRLRLREKIGADLLVTGVVDLDEHRTIALDDVGGLVGQGETSRGVRGERQRAFGRVEGDQERAILVRHALP